MHTYQEQGSSIGFIFLFSSFNVLKSFSKCIDGAYGVANLNELVKKTLKAASRKCIDGTYGVANLNELVKKTLKAASRPLSSNFFFTFNNHGGLGNQEHTHFYEC